MTSATRSHKVARGVSHRASDLQWLTGTGSFTHVFNLCVDPCHAAFPSRALQLTLRKRKKNAFLFVELSIM